MPLVTTDQIRPFAVDLDHPEGVAVGPNGAVYAGGTAGQVYRIDPETGKVEQIASTGRCVLGLAVDAAGNIYACDVGHRAVMRITASGEVSVYSKGNAGRAMFYPNYPVFGADGSLYVSDSGTRGRNDALIWRVHPGGRSEVWFPGPLDFANGLAITPDGRSLLVIESFHARVSRIPVGPGGEALAPAEVVQIPGTVLDGLAFDSEGALYISCYEPHRIYRLTAGGALTLFADDPTGKRLCNPTNVAFGGAWMAQLLIASLGGTVLTSVAAPVPGAPLFYPRMA